MSGAESFLQSIVDILRFGLESAAVAVLAIGVLVSLSLLLRAVGSWTSRNIYRARTVFLRFLVIVLELQLASDILGTVVAPEWAQIGQVGAIAAIRTFLNYALSHEIKELDEEDRYDRALDRSNTQGPQHTAG